MRFAVSVMGVEKRMDEVTGMVIGKCTDEVTGVEIGKWTGKVTGMGYPITRPYDAFQLVKAKIRYTKCPFTKQEAEAPRRKTFKEKQFIVTLTLCVPLCRNTLYSALTEYIHTCLCSLHESQVFIYMNNSDWARE